MRKNNGFNNFFVPADDSIMDEYGDVLDPMEVEDQDMYEEDVDADADTEAEKILPPDIEAGAVEHELLHSYFQDLKQSSEKIPDNLQICLDLEGYVWTILSTKFSTYFRYYTDLYSEAMLAILEAFPKYDASKGAKTTFFQPYILHGICAWINQYIMFTTPHYQAAETQINDTLRAHSKEELSEKEIAAYANLSLVTVRKVMCMKQMRKLSWSRELSDSRFLEMVYDEMYPKFVSPEQLVERAGEGTLLMELLSVLDEDDRKLVSDYYGLDGKAPKKLSMLAEEYGTTKYFILKRLNTCLMTMKTASKKNRRNKNKKGRN